MSSFLSIVDIQSADRTRVGGKALQLSRLARRRLPVPPAFAVTTDGFRSVLRHNGLVPLAEKLEATGDLADAKRMRKALANAKLPPLFERSLSRLLSQLGPRVAVRSSGVEEDGRERSFAGMYLSVLNTHHSGVPDALRACWASLYDERVLSYRGGAGPAVGCMAVLVQEMVVPVTSGVMFTVNPLTGSWREMVVEATWGLGEGLMSGQVTPHWYLVRRPRKAPAPLQRFLSRVRLHVMQEDLPDIAERWVCATDGTVRREPMPGHFAGERTLPKRELLRLCRLGLRVEAELGEPADVEWAVDASGKIHLLQARPITSSGTPRVRTDVLWTRRFFGERWTKPATPLGWSMTAPILEWFIAYPKTQKRYLGGGPSIRLVASRPFFNVTVFRHLTFKFPGAPPPGFMLEFLPREEVWAWRRRFAVMPGIAVYLSILSETLAERRWQRFRWNPFTNHRRWDDYERRLDAELPPLTRTPHSSADAIRLVNAQLALLRGYIEVHITSLLFANLFYQVLEGALANALPEQAMDLMDALAVCPPGNRTLEVNAALFDLVALAKDGELAALEDRQPLGDSAFSVALAEFLAAYGHRSDSSWEIFSPRWVDYPHLLAPLLRAAAASGVDPSTHAKSQQDAFTFAEQRYRKLLSADPGRRWMLTGLVYLTRRYLLLRENQRFQFDRLLLATQHTMHWLGKELERTHGLADYHDISFLTWDEVQGAVSGALSPAEVVNAVAQRQRERQEDLAVEPPVFLYGDEGADVQPSGSRLQGLGISPGRHRGTVRLIASLTDGHKLKPGDVLVTRSVDPAWTPLFLTAGAVILEMGSRLSHGAVVAREYKVPAVVNIDGIVRRLNDGQEVTVDGQRGVVWVHG